jgi:hypothetical protein
VRGTGVSGIEVGEDKSNSANSSRLFFSNATTNQVCAIFNQSNHLDFYTNGQIGSTTGAQRMRINNGNFVTANGSFRAPIFYDSSNTGRYVDPANTGDSIRCSGDIVAYYSDERLKDRGENITGALDKVLSLNGFHYTPNETAQKYGYKKKPQVGLSAQEVEAVLPEVVKDAAIGDGYKTVDYAKLVPLLVEAIKDLKAEVDELRRDAVTVTHKDD